MCRASMIREKVPWEKGGDTGKLGMLLKNPKHSEQAGGGLGDARVSWGGCLSVCPFSLSSRKCKNFLKCGFLTCFFSLLVQDVT